MTGLMSLRGLDGPWRLAQDGGQEGALVAKRRFVALVVCLAVVVGCDTAVPTSPAASPSPPAAQPAGQPITFQLYNLPGLAGVEVARFAPPHDIIMSMVHAALYRHDASLVPVPDLAAELCDVAADLVTITCTIRAATFHDGSPVTADDVAFIYEIARSPACPFTQCWTNHLASVEAVDPRTVRFTLARPYAPFVTTGLADVFVLPRTRLEDAYRAFADASENADPGRLRDLRDRVQAGLGAAEPECESTLEEAESMLREIGVEPGDRALFVVFGGRAFDACSYADYLTRSLDAAASSLESEGVDAIAAAYSILPFTSYRADLIGAGPWRLGDVDPAAGVTLERHAQYHHGAPLTPEIRIRLIRDEAEIDEGLADGSLDWRVISPRGQLPDPQALPSLRLTAAPAFGYRAIQYNVRPGRVFADRNLRQAMELCIDKERTVEAATDRGVAIYSPIPPGSWAYQPGLAKARDVEAARELIEASGWRMGTDGVYELDGQRLAAEVVIRADFEAPISFLDRAATQVRECGIELTTRLTEFRDAFRMLDTFPHLVPGSSQPFDAYLGGWGLGFDPDVLDFFHSSRATTDSRSGGPNLNYIGFSNAEVDRLLEDGVATYDIAQRTQIYRQLQRVLAEEQPYLFAWADTQHEALDADLTSAGAPLDFSSHHWWWQLEALQNPAE